MKHRDGQAGAEHGDNHRRLSGKIGLSRLEIK